MRCLFRFSPAPSELWLTGYAVLLQAFTCLSQCLIQVRLSLELGPFPTGRVYFWLAPCGQSRDAKTVMAAGLSGDRQNPQRYEGIEHAVNTILSMMPTDAFCVSPVSLLRCEALIVKMMS